MAMQAMVYTPAMQAVGQFDDGKIVEQKPIGFPGEGSVIKRVGPLFYWAWATASADASIGLHPHQGFEILTYVVEGQAAHGDTLGTDSTVSAGGVQVMQTGSGVSHQEGIGKGSELFQIWFEPEWTQAVKREPTYRQYAHEDFPLAADGNGLHSVKTLIGDGAPVELVADAAMWDVEVKGGATYRHSVPAGYTLTGLAIRGQGTWGEANGLREPTRFRHRDFIVAGAAADTEVEIASVGEGVAGESVEALRMILIQVPTTVGYTLYRKR